MVVDTIKEMLLMNQKLGHKMQNILIEGDIIVTDVKPDILNTINTSGNIVIYKKEVMDGKVRIDGSIHLHIMYLADNEENSIRGLNAEVDFTEIIEFPEAQNGMLLETDFDLKSIECKVLNGRKINTKSLIEIELKLYANNKFEVIKEIKDIDNMQFLKRNLEINSLIGEGTQKTVIKDTINLDNAVQVAEILKANIDIVNKDIKLSYNKVLAKADAEIKLIYLTEDNEIKVTTASLPVMGFIDIQNIDDGMICDINYEIKNIIIKPNNQDDHSIYVELEIELTGKAFEVKMIDVIDDLYSPSIPLSFTSNKIKACQQVFNLRDTCTTKEKLNIKELEGNKVCDVSCKPHITSKKVIQNKIVFEGVINVDLLYTSEDSIALANKLIEVPVHFEIDNKDVNLDVNIDINVETKNFDFIILPNGEIDLKVETLFLVNVSRDIEVNIIDEITASETRADEDYGLIIYYTKRGDSLWEIAKKFNSTIDDIAKENNIENPYNHILKVGEQLFIPKVLYTRKQSNAV